MQGLIPGSGRCPEVRNGNPLQYSCLGNPMDRRTSPRGHKELDTTEHTHTYGSRVLYLKIMNMEYFPLENNVFFSYL